MWGSNSGPSRYSTTHKTAPYHGARSKLFNSERTSWEHYYVGLAHARHNNDYSENGVHICIVVQLSCVHMSRFWACVVVQVASRLPCLCIAISTIFYLPQVEMPLCGELKETGVGMVDCKSKSQTTTQPSQLTNNAQLSTENLTSITLDHLCLVIHAWT